MTSLISCKVETARLMKAYPSTSPLLLGCRTDKVVKQYWYKFPNGSVLTLYKLCTYIIMCT